MKVRLLLSLDPYDALYVADARNALFNYMMAKHHHGHISLRLEDAKESPGTPGAPIDALKWVGIDMELLSGESGERFRMYRASERLPVYEEFAQRLLSRNAAYRCFCSRETLRDMFQHQRIHGQVQHYDRRCLRLSPSEQENLVAAKSPYQVRLRAPEVVTEVHDVVRGRLVFDPHDVADLVVLRHGGLPSPALANTVDIHQFEITYVMRDDRLSVETRREAFLFQALGLKAPEYIHLPLILGEDRSLFSERHGDKTIEALREKGFLNDAVLNYLSFHGMEPGPEDQLRTLGTLVRTFRLDGLKQDPTIWQVEKLKHFNRLCLEKIRDEQLVPLLAPYVKSKGHDLLLYGEAWAKEFVAAIRHGMSTLSDVGDFAEVFFADKFVPDKKGQLLLKDPDSKKVVEAIESQLGKMAEVTHDNYRELLDAARSQLTVKGKALLTVRVALSGQESGPEFAKLLPLLGKQRLLARLENARRYIPKGMKRDF